MYEDKIKSNRTRALIDIIEREGFDFSVVQMHGMLDAWYEFDRGLLPNFLTLRSMCTEPRKVLGYSALFWGSSREVKVTYFDARVYEYYAAIGDIDFYEGLQNEN